MNPAPVSTALVPAPPDFNYLPLPQFRTVPFSGEAEAQNGGLGNGSRFSSYYCGSYDEINSYNTLKGNSRLPFGPNSPEFRGSYKFVQIEDLCRTEEGDLHPRCGGGIAPDGECSLIGIPTHAMDCSPWVGGAVWDAPAYQENPPVTSGEEAPADPHHPGWEGRNNVDDGFGFVFGRYLVERVACARPDGSGSIPASEGASRLMTVVGESDSGTEQLDFDYDAFMFSPNYVDLPYSYHHLVSGFACPQVHNAGGYKKTNPEFGRRTLASGQEYQMDANWGSLHQYLIKQAADRLARSIASGEYGNMYPGSDGAGNMSVKDRETSQVVVNAWNILNWARDNIDWEPCSGFSCLGRVFRIFRETQPVELYSCKSISGNNPVEYLHDKNRLCVKSNVARSCESQRTVGSNPHFGVTGGYPDGDGRCMPSYGTWRDGGLYERSVQSSAGYELFEEDGHIRAREDGYVSVAGDAPFVTAQLAHQICHAFLKKTRNMDQVATWPSNGALWEEGLCVMTEAIVYTNLCKLGYCSHNFKMEKKDFVRDLVYARPSDPTSTILGVVRGERFSYPNYSRGYAGTFLGPYAATMMNIAQTIQYRSAEEAQVMAIMKAMAPTLTPPAQMYINGQESEFHLPEPTRGRGLFDTTDINAGEISVERATGTPAPPQPNINQMQKANDTKNAKGKGK